MKLFIIDFCNCLDLSHYETFFYKNIKDGNISVYSESLSSFSQFDLIHKWLLEEINRNPFSITEGLVLFFIPRNLTQNLDYYDIDNTAKIYIRELIASKLDSRFSYVCVYVDQTGKDTKHERSYLTIDEICKSFCSDEPALKRGMFSKSELLVTNTINELQNLINNIHDKIIQSFFSKVLETEILSSDKSSPFYDKAVKESFFQNCSKAIQPIHSFHVSYFGGDITQKIETLLKLITYVCNFAERDDSRNFDNKVDSFLDGREYDQFDPCYEEIRKRIATYKKRLSNWLDASKKPPEKKNNIPNTLKFQVSDESQSFKHRIENIITSDYAKKILNPSLDELEEFDASERVFSTLDKTIENVDRELRGFCDRIVKKIYDFRKDNRTVITEEASGAVYSAQENDELAAALDNINHYSINELPGFSAELKLRQELDLINSKIQFIGKRIKASKPKLFIATLLFSIISIVGFYFFAQNSVFSTEHTWWVFIGYNIICGLSFAFSYFILKAYYKRRVHKLLKECQKKINEFLESYKKRAEEFEQNINNAMNYSCVQDKHFKISEQRHDINWEDERFQWHKLKIMSILENLRFFDTFTSDVSPVDEMNVPKIPCPDMPYQHDAAHSEFYQMRIFN